MITFRPLIWTDRNTWDRRSRGTFKATWSSTLRLLETELHHLDARNVVIQADFAEHDLRIDGMPKANARQPNHPGIRIAFDSTHGPLTYSTDSCEYWQHNVRSIALGLQALRAVDRYGVTKRGEQYQGWAQLPAGNGSAPSSMTKLDAVRLVAEHAGVGFIASMDISDQVAMRLHFRRARANAHPDRNAGDSAAFLQLEHAGRLLGLVT